MLHAFNNTNKKKKVSPSTNSIIDVFTAYASELAPILLQKKIVTRDISHELITFLTQRQAHTITLLTQRQEHTRKRVTVKKKQRPLPSPTPPPLTTVSDDKGPPPTA